MTKVKMKEKATSKIESRIFSMSNAQDLTCLEMYDSNVAAMIRLTWQLELITKEERDDLELKAMYKYFDVKNNLEKKTA